MDRTVWSRLLFNLQLWLGHFPGEVGHGEAEEGDFGFGVLEGQEDKGDFGGVGGEAGEVGIQDVVRRGFSLRFFPLDGLC